MIRFVLILCLLAPAPAARVAAAISSSVSFPGRAILIGALFGALDGVGIFFEPRELYKWQILFAATLKGVLVALLTSFSLTPTSRWWVAILVGALYGFAFALVIYLAKGGPKSGDAPYVIPSGVATGGLIGLCLLKWAI
jgi:hypothetical protein